MSNAISKQLLKEAEILEGHAIDAFNEGKLSLDEYHQFGLMALLFFHEGIEPEYNSGEEYAFALGLARACATEIRRGIENKNLIYAIEALRIGNIGIGNSFSGKALKVLNSMIEDLKAKNEKYKNGPKKKSMDSKEKWALARQYLEEILKENPELALYEARELAARKAGKPCQSRQLIKKLPDPR